MSLSIYHGEEEWILKGLAVDLEAAFKHRFPNYPVQRVNSFGERVGDTQYHFFVQQGQLNHFIKKTNKVEILKDTICLFTHFDIKQFPLAKLNRCKAVMFMSSSQLSVAVANGLDASRAFVCPLGVDQKMHKIFPEHSTQKVQQLNDQLSRLSGRTAVGFCVRYWDKSAYVNRKRYELILKVAKVLTACEIPVIILGPGWKNCEYRFENKFINYIDLQYKYFPYVYNMMKVFCSVSLHEGGPVPLLESMSCGVTPVVTNTGFTFDVMSRDSSLNKNILAIDAPIHSIVSNILRAYENTIDPAKLRVLASEFSFEKASEAIHSRLSIT